MKSKPMPEVPGKPSRKGKEVEKLSIDVPSAGPKLYAVLLRDHFRDMVFVWTGIDIGLEFAYGRAKSEADKKFGMPSEWMLELWHIVPLEEALSNFSQQATKPDNKKPVFKTPDIDQTDKNAIMKEIIEKKDKRLLEIYRSLFSVEEIKLIVSKLK